MTEKIYCSDCHATEDENDMVINDFGNPVCGDCLLMNYELELAAEADKNQPPDYDWLALEWAGMEGY